jgi:hypothetical protein
MQDEIVTKGQLSHKLRKNTQTNGEQIAELEEIE